MKHFPVLRIPHSSSLEKQSTDISNNGCLNFFPSLPGSSLPLALQYRWMRSFIARKPISLNKREILPRRNFNPCNCFWSSGTSVSRISLTFTQDCIGVWKRGAAKYNGGPGTNMCHGDHLLLIPFIVWSTHVAWRTQGRRHGNLFFGSLSRHPILRF